MNIQKLFEMQRQLDLRIEQEHPRQEGEDRLAKKILALQVELGELANEWRGFKFWSGRQEPVTEDLRVVDYKESGEAILETYNPLLEEYVDCLHFILSIGLEIGVCPEELDAESIFFANVTEQFIDLFYEVSHLIYEERNGRLYEDYLRYDIVFEHFVGLGVMLGFTWEQIEQAYIQKNAVNFERQENGY